MWVTLSFHVVRRPESDCQAGPVSQDQIRQREHDIKFCLLFSEASVSGLLEFEQTLHYTEDMFYLGADRGFYVFPFLGLILPAFAEFSNLTRTTIDFVSDLLTSFVSYNRIFTLLGADIAAVAVYGFFLSMQQLGRHGHVADVGSRSLDGMHNATVPVYADMHLIAKMPGIAFLRLACIGIALLFLVLHGGRHRDDPHSIQEERIHVFNPR